MRKLLPGACQYRRALLYKFMLTTQYVRTTTVDIIVSRSSAPSDDSTPPGRTDHDRTAARCGRDVDDEHPNCAVLTSFTSTIIVHSKRFYCIAS
ncbi:hypothetical protein EVAR_39735_1 [Eumeta japonica]|uniref:Uncharacterized protein n=1 Tax=Eumeta variegata TaxID=151549 RepID=A0A4C1X6L4_EUMVA|nr:hypothetical protein EVAR_39735_1 [Eumeta japonica]